MLRNIQLRDGVISFLFMFLVQAGIFFVVPLFLSVALGLSAIETGVRLLPLSLTLLLFAAGVPKLRPNASPAAGRPPRLHRCCSPASCSWSPCSTSAPGRRSSPGRCCSPGAGLGAMASQLGAVTVSAVPDEQSGEVGGLQNTGTQLGASIGTALAGAVLISALTASFFTGIQNNPAVPDTVVAQAQTQLAGGVPFVSDKDLQAALSKANVPSETADAIVKENEQSRIDGLRAAARSSRSSRSSPCCSPAASRPSSPAPRPSRGHRRADETFRGPVT